MQEDLFKKMEECGKKQKFLDEALLKFHGKREDLNEL